MLEDLYFGKFIPWERRNKHKEKQLELVRRIEREVKYFSDKIPSEDYARFQALSALYSELSMAEEVDSFSYSFTMGALLMMDVMNKAEKMKEKETAL